MKTRLLAAALAVSMAFAQACAPGVDAAGSSANGSIAVTRDDALLYAADSDMDTVFVVDAKTNAKIAAIKVGRQPEKVLMGHDDTVFVTNRLSRSVSVIRRGDTTESARIDVGVEPVGLAQSNDGKTLYVVNATSLTETEFGTVQAFDTATLALKWEVPVGHEPRGIAVLPGNKGVVSLFKDGQVATIDLARGVVEKAGNDELFTQLNRSALGLTSTNNRTDFPNSTEPFPGAGSGNTGLNTVRPRGLEAVVPSADGKQVYIPGLVSSDATIDTRSVTVNNPVDDKSGSGGSGGYGGGNRCSGATSVAAPALLTLSADGTPQVDDLGSCGGAEIDRPGSVLTTSIAGVPVQGPVAATLDPTGSFLFVANRNSNNVSIVQTSQAAAQNSVNQANAKGDFSRAASNGNVTVNVGASPTGIAVSSDGKRVWVYNAFDHSISRIEKVTPNATEGVLRVVATQVIGEDTLSPDAVAGRKLFFSAVDSRMNNPGTGISCSTCHLEGREDGHVWNFIDGPRQTPSLAGRMTNQTAPFHWNGEFPDLMAFMTHTVTRSMGGSGVTPVMESQVAAFIATIPAADNPMKTAAPAAAVARGQAVFSKANCDSCHSGAALTDNSFADVGTFVKGKATGNDDMQFFAKGGLNTPSLLGVSRSGPFLHDGSAPTLKARIMNNKANNKHGTTAMLTDAEVDDLVVYLKTL